MGNQMPFLRSWRPLFMSYLMLACMFAGNIVLAQTLESVPLDELDPDMRVAFPSAAPPSKQYPKTPERIWGYLYRPEGAGPHPTVVLLHGCAGITGQRQWAQRLVVWGYVALIVDHFGPRRVQNLCQETGYRIRVPADIQVADAYGALKYLESLAFVNSERIGAIGWSQTAGSSTVISSLEANPNQVDRPAPLVEAWARGRRFKAAVAFYPRCPTSDIVPYPKVALYAPLLILIGGADPFSRPQYCRLMAEDSQASGTPIRLQVYDGAGHGFDLGVEGLLGGQYRVQFDPQATQDAITRVKAFLAEAL